MAGFLNAFIPTSQIAGGGLAEWQAARERYAKQQQALQGYKAGL